jgi:hypothetical protein
LQSQSSEGSNHEYEARKNVTDEKSACIEISRNEIMEEVVDDKEMSLNQTCPIPWTICEKWDTCSIGTLPGYIS